LIVLGAYFGTGNYGGMLTVFLMGVYDKSEKVFLNVCKVREKEKERKREEREESKRRNGGVLF
jgi:ATP-dependent DNA ligase